MSWWRRRPAPLVLQHSWTDRVDSNEPDVEFAVRIHITVRADAADGGRSRGLTGASRWSTAPPGSHTYDNGGDDSTDRVGDPEAAAIWQAAAWVRYQVKSVAGEWSVLRRQAAQHDLNDRLSRRLPCDNDGYIVVAVTAALSVPPESHQAALDLQQQRREAQLDELARRQAAATMRFLRQECFDNPASARLFLMLNASSRLGVFPNADQAEDVVTEVNKWHPDTLWVQVARTLQTALASLTPGQTDELLRLLSVMLRTTGHPSQADELNDLRSPATDSAEANGHSFGATQPH